MARMLVVDDEAEVRNLVRRALELDGHEVELAADGSAALAAMHRRPPDLVILDVMFPGDNFAGFELARAMCRSPGLKQVPILILTGVNQQLCMKVSTFDIDNSWLPVTDFLEKPVDFEMLVSKVESLLQAAGSAPKRAD